ncbi:hypothetical protein A9W99_13710 [Mycobacterium sp. 1164966.3]|uniref:hypothetical protein n=1 Tax=Mycobacterium sp. 1164966.3 TaxID=1856861 RepID=UPI000801F9F0|nr:hypothetical protein [Mycobacterium sp. 1164966.3]OBA81770.1 hypothetical protein A9W99_13710 [Mycobacterium sp. 1164966.3]
MQLSDSQLRRRAHAKGLRLIKYRERSQWYAQYGPYALADDNNCLVAYGMSADALERELCCNG